MYNLAKTFLLFLLTLYLPAACANAPKVSGTEDARLTENTAAGDFSSVQGKDWLLTELRNSFSVIKINRDVYAKEGFGEFFSLRFDVERIGGVGAPNRYFAPYTQAGNDSLSIGLIAGTLMAAFREPAELKEHEFFALLQNVFQWKLAGDNLELFANNEAGSQTVLVFSVSSH